MFEESTEGNVALLRDMTDAGVPEEDAETVLASQQTKAQSVTNANDAYRIADEEIRFLKSRRIPLRRSKRRALNICFAMYLVTRVDIKGG